MNRSIFQREDFLLCDVPVPKGYPQSQTHSGIAFYNGEYYLISSPYPNKHRPRWQMYCLILLRKLSFGLLGNIADGEKYENPCLYRGVEPNPNVIPTRFVPIADNPLVPTPNPVNGLPAYNSDPDLYIEDGQFYILNRTIFRTEMLSKGYRSKTLITLIKGNLSNSRFDQVETVQIKEWASPYTSPCLIKFNGKYIFSYLDTNSAIDATTFSGLYVQTLNTIGDLAQNTIYSKVEVLSGDMLPWHMSLFQYKGILYSVVACVKMGDTSRKVWQMLGEFSKDLSRLTIYPIPLTDYNSYRGSACVREDGTFVLYSTTVWEKIDGSRSVDGRDIIAAQMPFEKLLQEIRGMK